MLSWRFHPTAKAELFQAADWYDQRQTGLGRRFIEAVEQALAFIAQFPEAAPVRLLGYRCKLLKTFPYAIFYRVSGAQLLIVAITHQRRQPYHWQKRTWS